MFGFSKPRTSVGKFIDRHDISQRELENGAKISNKTVSKITNDKSYEPSLTTRGKVVRFLVKRGHDVNHNDFWS